MMKKTLILTTVVIANLLAACSHENALLTQDKSETAHFLVDGGYYSEKQIKPTNRYGEDYELCVTNKILDKSYCKKLYKSMVHYAQVNKHPLFQNISVSDLEDPKVFYRVADYYHGYLFNLIPEE